MVTFGESIRFHLGGHTLEAIHVPGAHTDGDAIVHLREANVIHAGDIVLDGMYPFIDYGSGGHIAGMIAAVETILARSDANTKIITGHGGPSSMRSGSAPIATCWRRCTIDWSH